MSTEKKPARKKPAKKAVRKKVAPTGPGIDELKFMVDSAWERRTMLTPEEIEWATRPSVQRAVEGLETGEFRRPEVQGPQLSLL